MQSSEQPINQSTEPTQHSALKTQHSSTAEYLTFIASGGGSEDSLELRYEHENIWLTQKLMAELYGVSISAVNQHLKRIVNDGEILPEATIKKFLIVQKEGNREVKRSVDHYNLQAIIAVGFKIENERAVQFRKWASQIVKDYTIQGWVMDAERLKKGGKSVECGMLSNELPNSPLNIQNSPLKILFSAELAKEHAETEFEKYRLIQDKLYTSDFDRFLQLEQNSKPLPPNDQ